MILKFYVRKDKSGEETSFPGRERVRYAIFLKKIAFTTTRLLKRRHIADRIGIFRDSRGMNSFGCFKS